MMMMMMMMMMWPIRNLKENGNTALKKSYIDISGTFEKYIS